MATKPTRARRALSDQGGRCRTTGARRAASILERAMLASGTRRGAGGSHDPDRLTHGFHTYPARMHRGIAAVAVRELSRPGATILDPFCGSGTVLVEAMVAGRRALGIDLNPVAVRIAEVKTLLAGARARARLLRTAAEVAAASEERVRSRVDARAPRSEVPFYGGHTLKELAGLHDEIRKVAHERDRRTLLMVFTSILIKVSRQRSDTSSHEERRRIRKGLPTELFLRRAEELVDRLAALSAAVPRGAKRAQILEGDARSLRELLPARTRVDLILASPPYGGTWDYVDHHARRYAWLDVDPRALARGEVGARRRSTGPGAPARWDRELSQILEAMASVVAPNGGVALLMGDSEVDGQRRDAHEQLARLAPRAGLELVATASQERRDPRAGRRRREHLVLLAPKKRTHK